MDFIPNPAARILYHVQATPSATANHPSDPHGPEAATRKRAPYEPKARAGKSFKTTKAR